MSRRASRSGAAAAASSSAPGESFDVAMSPSGDLSTGARRVAGGGRKRKEKAPIQDGEDDDAADEEAAEERKRQQSPEPAAAAAAGGKRQRVKTPSNSMAEEDAAAASAQVKVEDEPMDGSGSPDDGEEEVDDVEALAAAQGLSVYEYTRQQNIRLKNEQLQRLNLAGMSSELGLRQQPKAPVVRSSKPKVKREPQVGVRRSTRSSVADPNYVAPPPIYVPEAPMGTYDRARKEGVLKIDSAEALPAHIGEDGLDEEEKREYETVMATFQSALLLTSDSKQRGATAAEAYTKPGLFASAMRFRMVGDPNGKKVVKDRATVIKIHPTVSLSTKYTIVAAADKNGKVGIGRYENDVARSVWPSTLLAAQYAPHVNSIVDLHWSHADSHLLYSGSRDGSVRRLDITAGEFQEVFVEDEHDGASVSGLGLHPNHQAVLVGDRAGDVHLVDTRASGSRKKATRYSVGTKAVNSCVVSPLDAHCLLTGGLDRVVRAWDLRRMKADQPVREWVHTQAINSVVFSAEGRQACSTSYDDTLKVFSCVSQSGEALSADRWAPPTILRHDNQTGRWVSRFRGVFAPTEAALAIGDMKRAIDIFPLTKMNTAGAKTGKGEPSAPAAAAAAASSSSSAKKGKADSSSSSSSSTPQLPPTSGSMLKLHDGEFVTTIPAAVAWHPSRVQVVGCTGSGRIYVYEHTGNANQ